MTLRDDLKAELQALGAEVLFQEFPAIAYEEKSYFSRTRFADDFEHIAPSLMSEIANFDPKRIFLYQVERELDWKQNAQGEWLLPALPHYRIRYSHEATA